MSHNVIKSKLLHGFAWESVTRILIQTASWGSTIYVARELTPEAYGIMAVALVVTHILSFILEMGLSDGLIQRDEISASQIDGVFYVSVYSGILLAIVFFQIAPYLADFYNQPLLVDFFQILSFTVFISGFAVMPRALILRELDFKYRALVDTCANLSSIVVVVVMVFLGYGIWSLLFAYVALQTVITLGYLLKLRHWPIPKLYYKGLGEIVSFGYKLMISRLLNMVQTKSDVFLAGKYLPVDSLGHYTMALTFAGIPAAKIGVMFNIIAFPTLSKLSNDLVMVKKYYLDLQKYLFIICAPILVGLILVSEEFVIALLTDKWSDTIEIMQLLCLANIFIILGMIIPSVFAALGRSGFILKYNVFATFLLLGAIFVGVQGGLLVMGWFIVAAQLVAYIVIKIYMIRTLKIGYKELFDTYSHILIAIMVMTISVLLVKNLLSELHVIVLLTINITVGVVAYFACYYLFFRSELFKIYQGVKSLKSGENHD